MSGNFDRSLWIASEVMHLRSSTCIEGAGSLVFSAELGPKPSQEIVHLFVGQMKGMLVLEGISRMYGARLALSCTC